MTLTLYSISGELVTTIDLFELKSHPEIVVWKDRFFIWHNAEQRYRETLDFVIADNGYYSFRSENIEE